MNNRMKKAAREYQDKIDSRPEEDEGSTDYTFYASDFNEIREATGGDLWYSISLALTAGFMIGYRCRQREVTNMIDDFFEEHPHLLKDDEVVQVANNG